MMELELTGSQEPFPPSWQASDTGLKEFVLVAIFFKCPKGHANTEKGLLYLKKQEVEPKL